MWCRWIALASFVLLVGACDRGSGPDIIPSLPDTSPDAIIDEPNCNLIEQFGCSPAEKCTWIVDQAQPVALGHVGCAPDGDVPRGGACLYGPPGPQGYDSCERGAVCEQGTCKAICDPYRDAPTCDAEHACQVVPGFLGPEGSEQGGVCEAI